ncbi:lipoate--protein ligase family protein, partial [Staphylococcus pseudintermedius]
VYNSASLREITLRVYDALGMPLNPATVGAAEDANPALLMEDLEDAILEIYAQNGFK